jgi:Outer membrane protein beta-barrel domain
MYFLRSIIFLLALSCVSAHAQTYKGVFIGTNTSKIQNLIGLNKWKQGFVIGYALRSDLNKPTAVQMELVMSFEGGASSSLDNFRVVTCYLKAPLMANFKISDLANNGSLRFLVGIQPTFYMGGYAKFGDKVYRPRLWKDDEIRYFQPVINYFDEGKYAPRNWNIELTGGVELCRKHVNYGVRAAVGLLQNERFQNSSISLRLGF